MNEEYFKNWWNSQNPRLTDIPESQARFMFNSIIEYARGEQEPVAYLDIGESGYLDIGSDLTDEQLLALPKGRHALAIVGTWGVDGYTSTAPAKPAESEAVQGLVEALEIIAGQKPCADCLLSDRDIAMSALAAYKEVTKS